MSGLPLRLPSPGGTPIVALLEPGKSRVRRIRMHSLLWRTLAAPFLMVMVSCSPNDTTTATKTLEPGEPAVTKILSEPPKKLTCPSGEFVATDGGLLAAGGKLKGTETAGEAVEKWMASQGGIHYLLTEDASGAWVLRADGTARAKVNLLLGDGWVVHGYQACS